ncbi:prolyl aminopeptidase [Umezawaea beigongshangensis]|uniref:prolyl aminopeptidase n=1 Tax=Umezawaea beigongshangensis TaxID=2780383 RepID=UPI0027DE56B0|nr:prolyl aminopeptidase [Umezawaea beigongshangensis]
MTTRDSGMLDVGDGNLVHWEAGGDPGGTPALIVHGGPGAGSPPGTPRAFDPERFRVITFDQRGCGRSTPHASDPATDMSVNTAEHLLRDVELLREHLGVERWLLFGGSWGAALSLAYAERHPHRVLGLVLPAVWTMSRAEVDWLYRRGGAERLFPREWARFRDALPEHLRDGDPVAGYAALVEDPDPAVRAAAAVAWSAWEDAVLSREPHGAAAHYSDRDPDALLAFARICAHYAAHDGWLGDSVLRDAGKLAGIPGVMIHGRLDLSCPLSTAEALARAWPDAELVVVDDAGHRGSPAMGERVRAAITRFAGG